jgi:hypothetical protein
MANEKTKKFFSPPVRFTHLSKPEHRVYLSRDGGKRWIEIAHEGQGPDR